LTTAGTHRDEASPTQPESVPIRSAAKAVSVIASSTVAGQVLLLALSPVLTRLYAPEHFGVLAVFTAMTTMITVVSSWRWEFAVPLAANDRDALDVIILGALSIVITAAVVSFALIVGGEWVLHITATPSLQILLWCIPVAVVGGGAYQLLTYWVLRIRSFGVVASTSITRVVVQGAAQVGLGFIGQGGAGLVLGQVLGQLSGSTRMLRLVLKTGEGGYRPSREQLLARAREFRRFPLLSAPATLLNIGGRQAPPLIIASLAGPAWAGFYALAERVVNLPMRALGNAVGQVFYGEMSRFARDGRWREARGIFLRVTLAMFGVSLLPALVLATFGAPLFAFVFGAEWEVAGSIAGVLGVVMLFQLTTSPVSQTLNIFGLQGLQLAVDLLRFVGVVVAMVAVWRVSRDPLQMVRAYVAAMAVVYAVLWAVSLVVVARRSRLA